MTRAAGRVAFVIAAAIAWAGVPSAAAQVRNWPSEHPPRALAQRPYSFPPYTIRTLPNGLQVVVVPHREQPIVSVQMLVKAGTALDSPGKAGVASLVSSLLDQGTTTRTVGQIADAVDTAGAEFTVLTGSDMTFAQITVMADAFDFGLDMLSDVIRNPVFSSEELERQRQQMRSGLRVRYQDPGYIADVVFERLVFGLHPYGISGDGTPDSIARITRDDLEQFHTKYYVPNNAILAVVGDVTSGGALAAAERVFGGWARADIPASTMDDPPPPAKRVIIVDMPGSPQTEIRVGQIGIPRKNRDYIAADLAIRILGGEGGNRLQQLLRNSRGLTYGASADLEAYRLSGIVRAATATNPQAAGQALRLMIGEFSKLQREVVDEKELSKAQAYVTGSYPLGLETPGAISTKVLNALYYELPLEELETYREIANRLTCEAVNRVMQTYLRPDRLSIVLAGDSRYLVTALSSAGIQDPVVVPIADLDLDAADFRRTASLSRAMELPLASSGSLLVSRVEWLAARAVVERAAGAAGGADLLRGVKTLSATADTVLLTPAGPLRAQTKTLVQYPDRIRVDAKPPEGDSVQANDRGHAWLWDKHGPRDAPDTMQRELALSLRRDWIALLVAALDDRLTGRCLENETGIGGRALNVVQLWALGLPPVRLAIDAVTGQLVRIAYQVAGPAGPETVTESFSDFRFVDGVLFPFKAVTRREGAAVLERTVTELKLNPVLAPGTFDKPR